MRTGALWLTLLVAGTAMAGCLSGEDDTVDPQVDMDTDRTQWLTDANGSEVSADLFGAPLPEFDISFITERVSGEPTLGVTREGSIFYAAIDFDVAGGTLPSTIYYRSTDDGATWEDKSPHLAGVPTHPTSFDPYVYIDPTTGRVFAMDMGPHVACNKVSWSDDEGETWTMREGACIPGANDHPTIFAGPATPLTNTAVYPNQIYLCTNQVTDTLCYQSSNGGLDWFLATPAFIGYDPARFEPDTSLPDGPVNTVFSGLCGGLTGHGHVSWTDGTVYLGRGYCDEVTVAVSHDGGLTYDVKTISAEEEHSPSEHDVSIATDKAGNAYAFWVGNDNQAAYLSISRDQGNTWGTPINVTAPDVTAAKLPSIVAGDDGRIAFLYVGSENPLGWGVHEEECEEVPGALPPVTSTTECEFVHVDVLDNTTWNAYIGYSLNAHEDDPVFATTVANPLDDPLKRGPCDGRCTGAGYGMYDFLDIDIDPMTGQVYAALVDVCVNECAEPGAKWSDIFETETSHGIAARALPGLTLLEEPIAER